MSDKGGLTAPLFHCVFNAEGSITHYLNEVDPDLRRRLPHTYAVCLADNSSVPRRVVAGFFAKTTYLHTEDGFAVAMKSVVQALERLQPFQSANISFLPARINVPDGGPLSEDEMLRVLFQQYTKFSAVGTA